MIDNTTLSKGVKITKAFDNGQLVSTDQSADPHVVSITVDNKGGRNGANGPGFMQLDTRVGWRFRQAGGRTVDVTADILNVTDRSNFVSPTGDKRSTNFLLLTTLYGGGQPRQAQVGIRLGF